MFKYVYTLEGENIFSDHIRGFFGGILAFLFRWIGKVIDSIYKLADPNLIDATNFTKQLSEKLFSVLIIFMLFKVTISIMTYIIDPDAFFDKNKGMQNIIKRIIISIALLVSINPLFDTLHDVQEIIIGDNIVEFLTLGTSKAYIKKTSNGQKVYLDSFSPFCDIWGEEDNVEYRTVSFSQGDYVSLMALKPFYQPAPENEGNSSERKEKLISSGYCGVDTSKQIQYLDSSDFAIQSTLKSRRTSAYNYLDSSIYNDFTGNWSTERNWYLINFDYIWALVVGVIVLGISISLCFDIVKRSLSLMLLQVLAPVSIISYVTPQGKSSEILKKWFSNVFSTWASLFIRVGALYFAITCAGVANQELIKNDNGMVLNIIILIGTLIFAKSLPKFLESVFPGLKLDGGFSVNPFKKIQNEALGGKQLLGVGAGLGAAALSGGTNLLHRGGSFIRNGGWRDENGNFSLRNTAAGIGRTLGSGIAGAARGGVNAFGRTSKDGNVFGGAWKGYQTAMFSKLQREDNLRKAGLENAGFVERARFGIGGLVSDASRYTGVLNKGQQEYLNAAKQDEVIKQMEKGLANEKRQRLEPLQEYSKLAARFKERIENDKNVKKYQKALDVAMASGDTDEIKIAQDALDFEKNRAAQALFNDNSDLEIKSIKHRMDELRNSNIELQNEKYSLTKQSDDGQFTHAFNAGSIFNTQNYANYVEREITLDKRFDVEGYKRDDASVLAAVESAYNVSNLGSYKENHNENSVAKLQNASRINNDVQKPGFKPSNGPIQGRVTDNSNMSNFGGPGGPPPGPPPRP